MDAQDVNDAKHNEPDDIVEVVSWYWHFVDVVWLFLFISIYVWGSWGAPVHGM